MATEFDNSQHWGFFLTGTTLTSETGKFVRVSELVLAALRAAGVFENMVDGLVPPATDKLWLDKNYDPAQLKQWDATGSSWVPMTYNRLFGQAALGVLAVTGGTGNAVVVAQPNSGFQANRLYTMSPTANNSAGAVTIQVSGVGTYPVKYGDGSNLLPGEFTSGRQATLLFNGSVFTVLFSVGDLNAAVTAAAASASAASTSATNAATSASNAASAAAGALAPAIHAATAKTAFVDADELGFWDSVSGLLRKITLANFWAQSKWKTVKIGEHYYANTALAGVDVPPVSDPDVTFVELTAGLTGSGNFNNGKLTSESVSGSAPLVSASAVISVSGSPMNGQTIRLLNTEGRIVRPSTSPNTLQDDTYQGHWHNYDSNSGGRGTATVVGQTDVIDSASAGAVKTDRVKGSISDGVNGTPRTANETRMKNIGAKAYMRVK
ncbi:hypothetical protein ASE04_09620 [Rhizobium sp. Root708]|uniref:hypothetical protein n=1 Tax=Rhizobium sp. Root708 TaxID=1736592 RepID=UPI0006F7DDEC|nr:hypothetical protein [Rhizobium sp. Root708]KRB51782.1 hypothetical protein ASE04_09620 [Rhizobium sp. Root708]